VKTIGPLGPASIEILKEFCDQSENEFVFFRGKNITPKFYKDPGSRMSPGRGSLWKKHAGRIGTLRFEAHSHDSPT
jgi:hypothetical protein